MNSGIEKIVEAGPWLPQAPPFTFIDRICMGPSGFQSLFEVKEEAWLVRHGCLTAAGLVENMAQTAAAESGWEASSQDMPPPIGFLGAVSHLELQRLPRIGELLRTQIEKTHQILHARVLKATIWVDAERIASCEMKIFLENR